MNEVAQRGATAPLRCEACSAPFEARNVWPWVRIAIGAFIAMNVMTFSLSVNVSEVTPRERMALHTGLLAATLLTGAVVGSGLLRNACRELRRRRITIEALFLLGSGGAFAQSVISTVRGEGPVYYEVVAILLVVYALGRQLVSRSQEAALEALTRERREEVCEVVTDRGATEIRPVSQLSPGDVVTVKPGEGVPADGVIVSGEACLRETPLTGEAFLRNRKPGDRALAGTHPVDGLIRVRVTAAAAESEKARLLDEVGQSLGAAGAIERAADRLAHWFAPVVLSAAVFTYGGWSVAANQETALMHALSVLVVACPCAMGFATPLAFWAARRRLSALGLDVRGGETVERLASADCVVLDKTGTLTETDSHTLEEFHFRPVSGLEERDLELMLAAAERASNHPLAAAFEHFDAGIRNPFQVEQLTLVAGRGFRAQLSREGSGRNWDLTVGLADESGDEPFRRIEVAVDGQEAARALISERLHPSAGPALAEFKLLGLHRIVATGDSPARANQTPADERYASLRPTEKKRLVERLEKQGRRVLFVGDGLNDSGAMAASHASIAVRESAPLAAGVASAVMNGDDLRLIPRAIGECRQALSVARTNLLFAAGYNSLGITIAAAGMLHPVTAAIVMICSSLFVSWRASRLLPEEETVS